jgi:hypothetical protein
VAISVAKDCRSKNWPGDLLVNRRSLPELEWI